MGHLAKITLGAVLTFPLSLGMGAIVTEMFPYLAGTTAGVIGGASAVILTNVLILIRT